jgi:hypothetical protein
MLFEEARQHGIGGQRRVFHVIGSLSRFVTDRDQMCLIGSQQITLPIVKTGTYPRAAPEP